MPTELFLLAPAAFFAGLVDAMVGGGGLIQIPALLGVYPQTPIATLFGTNKLSSIAGTSASLWRYAGRVSIPWPVIFPATLAALVGSWWGASLVAWLPREFMRAVVLVLLVAVALHTFIRKDLGLAPSRELTRQDRWSSALLGLAIGFYDGFFGPGTGSFLMFAFIRFYGMDFLQASASAKMVNVATNFAAIAFFASHTPLLWLTALVMAASNLLGAYAGTHLALHHGSRLIRKVFLAVVVVLIARLAYDLLASR